MITDAVLDHIALSGTGDLLDSERLSELVGRPAAIASLRVKPGESLLVGWSSGPALADHGWAQLLTSADKKNGILRRADRLGAPVVSASRGRSHLLLGGVESDPRLASPLTRALRHLDDPTLDILRYNPGRRIVLRTVGASPDSEPQPPETQPNHRPHPDTDPNHRSLRDARPAWNRETSSKAAGIVSKGSRAQVLRVAAKSLLPLLAAEEDWERLGAPVIRHSIQRRRETAVVTPFWGVGDLSSVRDPRAAELAGRAIAGVHERSAGPTVVHAPGRGLVGMVETLTALLPHRADLLAEIAWRLGPSEDQSPTVSLHGDLTPDQILTDGTTVRIADLDRSHRGSAGMDLGWWSAGCEALGAPELEAAFLSGYASVRPAPDLDLWRARALLTFALIPFRRWQPDWIAETERRIDLAARGLGLTPDEEPRA